MPTIASLAPASRPAQPDDMPAGPARAPPGPVGSLRGLTWPTARIADAEVRETR